MRGSRVTARDLLRWLAALLVLKVVAVTFVSYRDYVPPDFRSDFLFAREGHFFGAYQWAFYPHIFAGPFTLVAGLVLLSEAFRQRWPRWHRRLGRAQVVCVVLLVAPSGFWMARHAAGGPIAGAGFAVLAIVTALAALVGWREAMKRRFASHRLWMTRCYALLSSAVVLRVIGGASETLGLEGTYPFAAWLSWIAPLAAVEVWRHARD